jgi:hypothetical protein
MRVWLAHKKAKKKLKKGQPKKAIPVNRENKYNTYLNK